MQGESGGTGAGISRFRVYFRRLSAVLCLPVAVFALLAVAGCTDRRDDKIPKKTATAGTLYIGLTPEYNIFRQLARYKPLADYLAGKSGRRIKLKVTARYGDIINNFTAAGLDGAFMGSFTSAMARQKSDVEFLVRPVGSDYSSIHYGIIFARKDSGIQTAAETKGKSFVFVDKATTAGYLLPLLYFKQHGIADYSRWFKETYFAGTHEDAVYDVLNRKTDIGAAKSSVFHRLARTDRRIRDELRILAHSPALPGNALAVRKDLDASLKAKIKKILLEMDKDQAGEKALHVLGAAKFITTTPADYLPVFKYAEQASYGVE